MYGGGWGHMHPFLQKDNSVPRCCFGTCTYSPLQGLENSSLLSRCPHQARPAAQVSMTAAQPPPAQVKSLYLPSGDMVGGSGWAEARRPLLTGFMPNSCPENRCPANQGLCTSAFSASCWRQTFSPPQLEKITAEVGE